MSRRVPVPGTVRELVAFAPVGTCAYAADLALCVALRGALGQDPLTAKALSSVAGCTVAYLGNADGTYSRRRAEQGTGLRAYAVFCGVNAAGTVVQVCCLAVSHHGLGLTSPCADAVSGLGIGMALATCLRLWGTRTLVFGRAGRENPWTG
ncbi:GtrA family protein [Streptomyces sp. NPDC002133]|uniref:GtrA family protein n=1 Tax=Streptomyces sp. NPDC002133 TaxID=3154409 RepID=UPI00331E8B9F